MTRSFRHLLALVLTALLVAGCAQVGKNADRSDVDSPDDLPAPHPGTVHEIQSYSRNDPEPPAVSDQELDTIAVEVNAKVEQWINYFQRKGRPYMERYLARSGRYATLMKRILRQNGLPEDLIYIALIESGFSSKITSRAAAVGYWQFIRGTGRRYGLEINPLIDERRDPVLSTQAAADYFKGLYSVFGSWYLAMASYNVGENRVMREVMRNHTRDFWELARKRRLPKETMNYVPKFIAAKLIAKSPEKYGFTEIEYEDPIEFELIRVEKPLNLKVMAEKMGLDYEDFKQLNPKFRGEIAPLKANGVLELRVPLKSSQQALLAANAAFVDKVDFVADAGETETYRIRSGDSLYTIARKYKTTVAWLRDVNDIKPKKRLRVGMRIQVPDRSAKKVAAVAKPKIVLAKVEKPTEKPIEKGAEKAAADSATEDSAQADKTEIETEQGVFYIVQQGDSLSSIAEEYDSSVKELLRMNKLRRGSVLRLGMKIKVPKEDQGLPTEPGADPVNGNVQDSVTPKNEREPGNTGIPGTQLKNNRPTRFAAVPQQYYRQLASATAEAPQRQARLQMQKPVAISTRVAMNAPQKVHVVRPGENLNGIATRYRVSIEKLQERNRLRSSNHLLAGSRLIIPR